MNRLIFIFLSAFYVLTSQGDVRVVFTPQWTAQAQFAGYYVALQKGFFRQEGLDVVIEHPSASSSSFSRVKKGRCQFSTCQLMTAISHINEGVPLVNILQTSQRNTQVIVSHQPIRNLRSLKGKRVGNWTAGFSALGKIMDKEHHLGITWIPFVQNVSLFISGAVDATMAQSYNEYFQILASGQPITKVNVLSMAEVGYDVPEDGLYVTAPYYRKHPDIVKRFRAAALRGWLYARTHPDETLHIVMKEMRISGLHPNRLAQKWMLKEIIKCMRDRKSGKVQTLLRPESVDFANRLLFRYGYIKRQVTYQQITKP